MAQREYELILSPELGISPADFATTWNELTETHTVGEARVVSAKGAEYDLTLVTTILISIATGAASNIISEMIMKVLEKRGGRGKHTHVERVKKLDGTESFVADIDEE